MPAAQGKRGRPALRAEVTNGTTEVSVVQGPETKTGVSGSRRDHLYCLLRHEAAFQQEAVLLVAALPLGWFLSSTWRGYALLIVSLLLLINGCGGLHYEREESGN